MTMPSTKCQYQVFSSPSFTISLRRPTATTPAKILRFTKEDTRCQKRPFTQQSQNVSKEEDIFFYKPIPKSCFHTVSLSTPKSVRFGDVDGVTFDSGEPIGALMPLPKGNLKLPEDAIYEEEDTNFRETKDNAAMLEEWEDGFDSDVEEHDEECLSLVDINNKGMIVWSPDENNNKKKK